MTIRTDKEELIALVRKLGDASYDIGIVVGVLDGLGRKREIRSLLAAHRHLNKAVQSLRSQATTLEGDDRDDK